MTAIFKDDHGNTILTCTTVDNISDYSLEKGYTLADVFSVRLTDMEVGYALEILGNRQIPDSKRTWFTFVGDDAKTIFANW